MIAFANSFRTEIYASSYKQVFYFSPQCIGILLNAPIYLRLPPNPSIIYSVSKNGAHNLSRTDRQNRQQGITKLQFY